jgi:hypothetical protein
MPENQNNQNFSKNLIISIALIAFIISSGAFTIYQIAKSNLPANKKLNQSVVTTSSSISSLDSLLDPSSSASIASQSSNTVTNSQISNLDITINLDPYICGGGLTGFVDKPENLQELLIKLTQIDNPSKAFDFKPLVDKDKNFKITFDYNEITNGNYNLKSLATLTDQTTRENNIFVNLSSNCENSAQNTNSTATNSAPIETKIVNAPVSPSIQEDTNNTMTNPQSNNQDTTGFATEIQASSSVVVNSTDSENQSTAPSTTPTEATNTASTKESEQLANAEAIRTGGNSFIITLVSLLMLAASITILKLQSKTPSFDSIFGKK